MTIGGKLILVFLFAYFGFGLARWIWLGWTMYKNRPAWPLHTIGWPWYLYQEKRKENLRLFLPGSKPSRGILFDCFVSASPFLLALLLGLKWGNSPLWCTILPFGGAFVGSVILPILGFICFALLIAMCGRKPPFST